MLHCRTLRLNTHNLIAIIGSLLLLTLNLLALQGSGTLLLQQLLALAGLNLELLLTLLLQALGSQAFLLLQLLLFQGSLTPHLRHLLTLPGFQTCGTLMLGLQQSLFALLGLTLQYQLLLSGRCITAASTAHPDHLLRVRGPTMQTGTLQHPPAIVTDTGGIAVPCRTVVTTPVPAIHPDIRDPDNRSLLIGLHGTHVFNTTGPGLCLGSCDQPETDSDNDFFHDSVSK